MSEEMTEEDDDEEEEEEETFGLSVRERRKASQKEKKITKCGQVTCHLLRTPQCLLLVLAA